MQTLGSKLVVTGESKKDKKDDPENNTELLTSQINHSSNGNNVNIDFEKISTVNSFDRSKTEKRRTKSSSNQRSESNQTSKIKVDSNGNIIKTSDLEEGEKGFNKKTGSKPKKQRSKSFHIKCDRTYTKYYQIEYKGFEKSPNSKSNRKKDTQKTDKFDSSPTASFDCSEEYFVDDDDDDQVEANLTNSTGSRMKRSSSLEPSDYNHVNEQKTTKEIVSANITENVMTGSNSTNFEKYTVEGYEMNNVRSCAKTSLSSDIYSKANNQIQTCRPTIQRYTPFSSKNVS